MNKPIILWPDFYRKPASNISRLVQQPLYQITPDKLIQAYMADYRNKREDND